MFGKKNSLAKQLSTITCVAVLGAWTGSAQVRAHFPGELLDASWRNAQTAVGSGSCVRIVVALTEYHSQAAHAGSFDFSEVLKVRDDCIQRLNNAERLLRVEEQQIVSERSAVGISQLTRGLRGSPSLPEAAPHRRAVIFTVIEP
jgi:Trp operon repressor